MKAIKKAIEVDVFEWDQKYTTQHKFWPDWLQNVAKDGIFWLGLDGVPLIRTLEGILTVRHKDWIIKGVKGEIYPCKPDIFEETYDLIDKA